MSEELAARTPVHGRRLWLPLILLAATFVTAAYAGSLFWAGTLDSDASLAANLSLEHLRSGVPYALLLLLILGAHELGHYFACRHYGVPATLPHFIPGIPLLIGTFGAVIRIRGPIPSRKALFDIAAAGPIAGFVVGLPILFLGLARATVLPPETAGPGGLLGPPLVSTILERWMYGKALLEVGPVYGAAWVGMLVTSMNLFPVGQLDGGHAVFALAPRAHRAISWATIALLGAGIVVQGVLFRSPSSYTLWLAILLFLRDRHPRLVEEQEPLGTARVAVAVSLGVIFVLSFIPIPISAG